MGQMYHACIYDIENKVKCVMCADKFHANCYSNSGTVAAAHYLLRQKPYNVMWGGGYITINDALADVEDEYVLLGISTYEDHESFESNNENIIKKPYYDKVKFIDEHSKTWEEMCVWDEAIEFFDLKNTGSVPYTGYLINHTKKLAVNLVDCHMKSLFWRGEHKDCLMAIDPIPVLTEIGNRKMGGSQMAYLRGVSAESTETLAGTWSGDLLQIVDALPDGFEIVMCSFADMWDRAYYCYKIFGLNDEGMVKERDSLYEAAPLGIMGNRWGICHIKIELSENKINFSTMPIESVE